MNLPAASIPPTKVSVMIVEDETAIRQMLVRFLEGTPQFSVVAEASDATEAVRLARELQPQIVILDWIMPGGSGLKFLREGLAGPRPPRVLVFSGNTTDHAVRDAFNFGAKGFLAKTASFSEFSVAMAAMAEGRVYMSPDVVRAVHRMSCHPAKAAVATNLTVREREVLVGLAQGKTSKEIAGELSVSLRTVGNVRTRITQKTGISSIAQLTLHAVTLGLVDGPAKRPETVALSASQ